MQNIPAAAAGVTRFTALHKAERFAVLINHGNGANIVVIHGGEGLRQRRRFAYRNGRLLVGDVARRYQQQAFQRPVLTNKRANKLIRGFRQQLVRAGALHDTPLTEDGNTVAQLQRFVNIVAHQHHGLFQLALHLKELVLDHLTVDRVDCTERFIHQQDRRIGCQRADDADALLLAAGHFTRIAVKEFMRIHCHHIHQLFGTGFTACLVPAQHARHDGNVLFDGHVREQANLLDHVANVAAQGHGVHSAGVFAVNQDCPATWRNETVDHLQCSGFPAAGRAEQHAHFPFRHVQVDVVDGLKRLAVFL